LVPFRCAVILFRYSAVPLFCSAIQTSTPLVHGLKFYQYTYWLFSDVPLFCSALLLKVNKNVLKSVDNAAMLLYNIPILNGNAD